MFNIKTFLKGYGSVLELFPKTGSIQNDWKMINIYMNEAVRNYSELKVGTKTKKRIGWSIFLWKKQIKEK
jgi:hypothetical protein